MKYVRICRMSMIAIIGLGSLALQAGCSKSDSKGAAGESGAKGAARSANSMPGEGPADSVKGVQAELDKHWLKTPDGWISQYHVLDSLDKPIDIFVELKEAKFEVGTKSTSTDADKQNGIEFGTMGVLYFSQRRLFAPDPHEPQKGKWDDWKPSRDETDFSVFRQSGTWQVGDWERRGPFQPGIAEFSRTNVPFAGVGLFNGTKPDSSAVAKLK